MKKITLLIAIGLLLFSANLFADEYTDCLETKRKEVQSEGAAFNESRDYAKEICNRQFNKKSEKKTDALSNNPKSGFFVSASPLFLGNAKVKTTIVLDRIPERTEEECYNYLGYRFCTTATYPAIPASSTSSEIDFNLGTGSRAGYVSKTFRIYLTNYTLAKFLDVDFKIQNIFVGGGVAVSGVLGNKVQGVSAHAGYIHSFSENLSVEGGLFFARATNEIEISSTPPIKHELEYTIAGLAIYLNYTF